MIALLLVCLHVSPQVGSVSKFFPAVSASIGLLPRVGPHVPLEQPRPRESFSADVALVTEVVSHDVHLEGWGAHVELVAIRTGFGVLCGEHFVRLLVPG